MSHHAKRHNRKARAVAYDIHTASGGNPEMRKPAAILAPSTPPPMPQLPAGVDPQVIPMEHGGDDDMSSYVQVFSGLGMAMAQEATALLPVISRLREDLSVAKMPDASF